MQSFLSIELLSDTTFGSGRGATGAVDIEVEHDPVTGLPIVPGRSVKGLLVEECFNILYSLERAGSPGIERVREAAALLFGTPGSQAGDEGNLHIADATLPVPLCVAVRAAITEPTNKAVTLSPVQVLESLTDIRRQTAVDQVTGAPQRNTLRSTRVATRGLSFLAPLSFTNTPSDAQLSLLTACALGVRRGGLSRNRGQGRLSVRFLEHRASEAAVDTTMAHFADFERLARGDAR